MADEAHSPNNVIAVNFEEDSNAYPALTLLKELDSQKQVDLQGAAVVARNDDGQIAEKAHITDGSLGATASGGLVGIASPHERERRSRSWFWL